MKVTDIEFLIGRVYDAIKTREEIALKNPTADEIFKLTRDIITLHNILTLLETIKK